MYSIDVRWNLLMNYCKLNALLTWLWWQTSLKKH